MGSLTGTTFPLALRFGSHFFSDQNLERVPGGENQSAEQARIALFVRIKTLSKCQAEMTQIAGSATECCLQFSHWNDFPLGPGLYRTSSPSPAPGSGSTTPIFSRPTPSPALGS